MPEVSSAPPAAPRNHLYSLSKAGRPDWPQQASASIIHPTAHRLSGRAATAVGRFVYPETIALAGLINHRTGHSALVDEV
jgi:hypothetical protein